MHNKNDILLVHLFLLFSLMMRAGFQISFWFSLFITKIDIYIKENNLNWDEKTHIITWIIIFLFMYFICLNTIFFYY